MRSDWTGRSSGRTCSPSSPTRTLVGACSRVRLEGFRSDVHHADSILMIHHMTVVQPPPRGCLSTWAGWPCNQQTLSCSWLQCQVEGFRRDVYNADSILVMDHMPSQPLPLTADSILVMDHMPSQPLPVKHAGVC